MQSYDSNVCCIFMKKRRGFTLIELMVTLVVGGILLTVAVPSFLSQMTGSQISTQANLFMAAIANARSEAIKLNQVVTICERNTAGTGCNDNGGWEDGWIIFTDAGALGVVNAPDDEVLQTFDPMPDNYTMAGDLGGSISFLPSGELSSNSGSFVICHTNGDANNAYTIYLNSAGRPRKAKDVTSC